MKPLPPHHLPDTTHAAYIALIVSLLNFGLGLGALGAAVAALAGLR